MAKELRVCIFNALKTHLQAKMPEIQQFIDQFPAPNEQLKYPCLSIVVDEPQFVPCSPYILDSDSIVENEMASRYVVGQREIKLKLDLWCRSRFERDKLSRKLFEAMNSQFPVLGLSLSLPDYFGVIARLELDRTRYNDAEESSQRREWRLIADVSGNCHEILEHVDHVIESIDITSEFTTNVVEE